MSLLPLNSRFGCAHHIYCWSRSTCADGTMPHRGRFFAPTTLPSPLPSPAAGPSPIGPSQLNLVVSVCLAQLFQLSHFPISNCARHRQICTVLIKGCSSEIIPDPCGRLPSLERHEAPATAYRHGEWDNGEWGSSLWMRQRASGLTS